MWNNKTYKQLVKFNKSIDKNERDEIYNKYLHEPFSELVYDTVFTYSDYKSDHDIHVDALSNLVERIAHMDSKKTNTHPDPPYQAFIYASLIVKSFVCDYRKKEYDKRKTEVPYNIL
jgi:hypothetical protein